MPSRCARDPRLTEPSFAGIPVEFGHSTATPGRRPPVERPIGLLQRVKLVDWCGSEPPGRSEVGGGSEDGAVRGGGGEPAYSHSIVAGGFDEMSRATRLTPATSLMIRFEARSSRSYGSRAQSAVIASSEVTARITIG
jgi:hypothetical protein